jgi:hypothetical protein
MRKRRITMRSVSFNVLLEGGGQAPVACGPSADPLLALARKCRDAGLATVGGEAVPIIGGFVFATDGFAAPAFEFRCMTPAQRDAKAKIDAKIAADKAKADAKAAKEKEVAKAQALLDAAATVKADQKGK